METKEIRTTFYLSEFEEEEIWLGVQHTQGWRLTSVTRGRYHFEACPKEEWVYRLDFRSRDVRREEYLQLFADCGWEFVLQNGRWFYFRKKGSDADPDPVLFSDRDSKIDLCTRVLRGKLTVSAALFGVSCVLVLLTVFTDIFYGDYVLIPALPHLSDFIMAALPWLGMGLMVACSFAFREYRKLQKRIDTLRSPVL